MLGVGQKFPAFNLKATVDVTMDKAFIDVTESTYKGKWLVVFFWPKDFTFVCPTEISAFGDVDEEFKKRGAQVLGASIDSEFVHLAWKQNHPDLKELPFPMMADIKRELTSALGILDPEAGVAQRAAYIVDPEGKIRFVMVTDLGIGRNVAEIIRVLDALQTGGLTPCNWKKGEKTIQI